MAWSWTTVHCEHLFKNIFTTPNLKACAISSLRYSLLGLDHCMQIQNKYIYVSIYFILVL